MKHVVRVSATILMLLSTTATVTHAQTAGPAGLTNGLVTWLQLDEQAGNRAQDASGTGRSALIENGMAAPVTGRTSGSGGILLSGTKNLRIPLAWQPARFTISWWVAPNSRGAWTQAVKAGWWGGFLFHTSPDGTIYVGTDLSNRITTAAGVFELNPSPTQPRWQLYTFTFEKAATPGATTGTGRLYKNGVEIGSRTTMRLPDAWTELTIGSTDSQYAADGYYDDVRVYDRALSATEVAQLTTVTAKVDTPPSLPSEDLDRNWSATISYDGNGTIVGASKSFSDGLGRPIQSQAKNQTTGHVLAAQTVYNAAGQPALTSLAAPTYNSEFSYKDKLLTVGSNDNYQAVHFEGANKNAPSPVRTIEKGSVGYYYSTNNEWEPLTAATNYPFSLAERYDEPQGGIKKATGPGDDFRMGLGREAKGREFPLLDELSHYLSLRQQFVPGASFGATQRIRGTKTVAVNADGIEAISFVDADGKLLATCLSGSQYPGITVSTAIHADPANSGSLPQYQDLHIPAAGSTRLTVQGTGTIRVVNLLTDVSTTYTYPWPAISVEPGFYRVISDRDNQAISYLARYGEFSYSYYNDVSQVVATVAPRGLTQGLELENLVKNPGFELDAATQNPQFWQTDQNTGMAYTETYGGARSGTYHGTHYSGGSNYYAFTHQIITGLPNGRYTLRAWTKGSGGQTKAYLLARNFGGNLVYTSFPTTVGGPLGEWSLVELRDIAVSNGQCDIGFESQAAAGQFIYYDDVEFFRQPDTATPQFVTRNSYSGVGTLVATESTDEGRTEFVYARDGRVRFSQNSLQKQQNRFSYVHYDEVGRVAESGEYQTTAGQGHAFENQLPLVTAYEAENPAVASSFPAPTLNSGWSGYRGSGYVENLTSPNTYVQFEVNAPRAGRYSVVVRYAAGLTNSLRTMAVYNNGSYQFRADFPATNAWSNWAEQVIDLTLVQGNNSVRLQHDGIGNDGWINVDYMELLQEKTPATNSVLTLLEERWPTNSLDVARYTQRNQIWYDLPTQDSQLNGRVQGFVQGTVTKTSNGTNSTWYSYDELGRVSWMVQQVPGVGVKTVDYTYDLLGNVLEVAYQKGQPDAFYHHYEYDADKRLRSVYTSTDGVATNRTLQARYSYYIHGPLKRVEIADRLQGIDYAYTVQGWLKSINNAEKRLDSDSPTANGTLKDLFGLRLDYFNGDYRSRQVTAPTLSGTTAGPRYDGTVKASSWHTVAAPMVHGYAYEYDAKGQLLQSDYGTLTGGNLFTRDAARKYEEGNLSYDTHGNILTLRRRYDATTPLDDFTYQYIANTNKLTAVKQSGSNVFSYEYDAVGQMTREAEAGKGDKYLRYDAAGKVTGVYRNANFATPIATYTYDDRGFRASKVVYNEAGVAQNTTYYVTDADGSVLSVYEQKAGSSLQLIEIPLYGSDRIGTLTRLDDQAGTMEPRYELNDQLGNARVVFRKPTTTTYVATMNANQASQEESNFENLPATRRQDAARAYDDTYVAALYGVGEGPKKRLTVEKGDTVTFSTQAFYFANEIARPSALRLAPLATTAAVLAPFPTMPSSSSKTEGSTARPNIFGRVAVGVSILGIGSRIQQRPASTTGVALLLIRYRFYDKNNTLKAEDTKYISGSPEAWQKLQLGFRVPEEGTLEVTTLNQSFNYAGYFDHIEVAHTTSTIVQEQHQYAFGSPLTGLNYTVGNKRYRHGYQGQFADNDEETGYDSFELRLYNSRIGRWTSTDPAGQFHSPYVGMGNNPVTGIDTDGGWSYLASAGLGMAIGGTVGAYIGYKNEGREGMWGGMAIGAGLGGITGGLVHWGVSNLSLPNARMGALSSSAPLTTLGKTSSRVGLGSRAYTFEGIRIFAAKSLEPKQAFTLPGVGIFVNPDDMHNIDILRHEFGHILQARMWGKKYFYSTVVPASISSAASISPTFHHYDTWTEWTANYYSYKYFGEPANWNFVEFPVQPPATNRPGSRKPGLDTEMYILKKNNPGSFR